MTFLCPRPRWLIGVMLSAGVHLTRQTSTLGAQSVGTLNPPARRAAVEKASDLLRTRYIFPDVGEAAAKRIETELSAGNYDSLPDRWRFAQKLTSDLQSMTHDKHMRVFAGPGPAGVGVGQEATPPPTSEFGIVRPDRLDGDVGYIEISSFPAPERFRLSVDSAMTALKDTKALIVDLRRSSGGSADAVGYLVSYFVDPSKPILLHIFFDREPGTPRVSKRTQTTVKTPMSYRSRPIYVLTSGRAFSGAEQFAYDIQSFKLGTVVGEPTGGGANGGRLFPIGSDMDLFVPTARQENPVTGTNWEGVGVKPDVVTPNDIALKVALENLGQHPDSASIEALSKAKVFAPRTTESPLAKSALLRMIGELRRGKPNYDLMSKELARATREQLKDIEKDLAELGDFTSASFLRVDDGRDAYDVAFANGVLRWRLLVDKDGRVVISQYSRAPR